MLVTCQQMRLAEERAFASGIPAETLMESAGRNCAEVIHRYFPRPGTARLYVGSGNNGGDALVVGRWLRRWGWRVEARHTVEAGAMTPLAARQRALLEETDAPAGTDAGGRAWGPVVLVDGLLGIGARGPLRGAIAGAAAELNAARREWRATVFALDVPSGVDGDTGEVHPGAVTAQVTLALSQVKTGLVAGQAVNAVGRLVLVPVPGIPQAEDGAGDAGQALVSPVSFRDWLPERPFDFHKGQAGRVALVAGSEGFTGAARLCAAGALHGGAGLVTLWVPRSIYPIVAAGTEPEVMVRPYGTLAEMEAVAADVVALGPGWGEHRPPGWERLALEDHRPVVLDADALNALASDPRGLARVGESGVRLLTPHPGEFRRLAPDLAALPRGEAARAFVGRHRVTLLYKGARTLVARSCRPLYHNATGHPGMASGGMGDVLTGLCAALLAQGLPPDRAAALGSWLLGRAAESLVLGPEATESAESLSAAQVAGRLGLAFRDWREGWG